MTLTDDGIALVDELLATAQPPIGSPAQLDSAIRELINSGRLAPGTRLPSMQHLVERTQVSRSSVARIWNGLRNDGLIITNKRGGSLVAAPGGNSLSNDSADHDWRSIDLSIGRPDITLQPDLHAAVLAGLNSPHLNEGNPEYLTTRLHDAVVANWPYAPTALTTVGGRAEAIFQTLRLVGPPGTVLAAVEPLSPGLLGTIRRLGLSTLPVESDESGPTVSSLRDALQHGAAAFLLDTSSAYAVAGQLTASRAEELAATIREADRPILVIEDDVLGPLAPSPSVLTHLGDTQALHITNYCKAYGIDLRTSVISGASHLIREIVHQRSDIGSSNSRILQDALAHIAGQTSTARAMRATWARYEHRRTLLTRALTANGVTWRHGSNAIVLWIEVEDEARALVALTERGYMVGGASQSLLTSQARPWLRVAITQLPDEATRVDELAAAIADAASGRIDELAD